MKKRLSTVFFALILCLSMATPALAGTEPGFDSQFPRVNDWADLLTDSEEAALQEKLDELSVRQQMDVIVVTAQDTDGRKSVQDYADDIYDDSGYGYGENKDGILLLICMEERDWYISTCGYGISVFTDKNIAYIGQQIRPDLSNGNYAAAFNTYAEECDRLITRAAGGTDDDDYDDGDYEDVGGWYVLFLVPLYWIPLALGIGLLLALIVVGIMKGKLKTVRFQPGAGSYLKKDSLQITESSDLFLYSSVSRTARPKDNDNSGSSTHESSGGVTHGGGGGKF